MLLMLTGLSGCATWSTSSVKPGSAPAVRDKERRTATSPELILVTEGDILDRRYEVLGDIKVTVNKTSIFHTDPTREDVVQKLRKKAAKLGADAVIFVRYGSVGVSAMSWGAQEGRGRAIIFTR